MNLCRKKKIISSICAITDTTGEFNFVKDASDSERFSEILKDEVKWKIILVKILVIYIF